MNKKNKMKYKPKSLGKRLPNKSDKTVKSEQFRKSEELTCTRVPNCNICK